MSVQAAADTVEIAIGGKAIVPEKYAHVLSVMNSQSDDTWQEVADAWVQTLREMAAAGKMEVDEIIAQVLAEAETKSPDEASK